MCNALRRVAALNSGAYFVSSFLLLSLSLIARKPNNSTNLRNFAFAKGFVKISAGFSSVGMYTHWYFSIFNSLANEVISNVDMLRSRVKLVVFRQCDSSLIIGANRYCLRGLVSNFTDEHAQPQRLLSGVSRTPEYRWEGQMEISENLANMFG